jgi:acyl-ACP thioesterase
MDDSMSSIPTEYILEGSVSYWNVDRDNLLSLRSLFAFLQEAAIRHADQADAGARAKAARGESWVLNRMAVSVRRYPRYEEALRVVTWSSGIRTFKGYRDFRAYCGDELVVSASSVWLYFNLVSKAICRVPREVAERFPSNPGGVFRPDLEKLSLDPPMADSIAREVSVRYSDFDGNGHVNNTAYFDFEGLPRGAGSGGGLQPRRPGWSLCARAYVLSEI